MFKPAERNGWVWILQKGIRIILSVHHVMFYISLAKSVFRGIFRFVACHFGVDLISSSSRFLHNFFLHSLSLCPLFGHPMNQHISMYTLYIFKHVWRAVIVIMCCEMKLFVFFFHFDRKKKKIYRYWVVCVLFIFLKTYMHTLNHVTYTKNENKNRHIHALYRYHVYV